MSEIKHRYIAVSYRLFVDGDKGKEMVEEAPDEQPFYFLTGFGIALDAFEKKLTDVPQGETFEFSLEKEDAYGDYMLEHVVELDREIFTVDGKFDHEHIFVDAVVPLQNEDGNRFYGKIVEVGDKVKVDLNHPLAGETLHFAGKVLENREATDDEVKRMIARMSGGCGGNCGGGCGGGGCQEGKCGGNCDCEN